jgi:anti-sigma regulatory factor (Ser/Thr protein kinase)
MKKETPYTFKIRIPSDMDYIAPVRKFVSELLQIQHFNSKFSFRSEIIVDEICHNAVLYGSKTIDATIDLVCTICSDSVEFHINDQGGTNDDIKRLKMVIENKEEKTEKEIETLRESKGLGLEIVRMLSNEVDLKIDKDNMTSIHIVRKREAD